MLIRNFIGEEIARHCPNPSAKSELMIVNIPLVLWQILLLAEDASWSSPYLIDRTLRLVATASTNLASGGIAVAQGSLVRKVGGPLLAQYTSLCVSRRFADADVKRVFCDKFRPQLYDCTSQEEKELIGPLALYELRRALYCCDATALLTGQVPCAEATPKIIQLGRDLFA